LVNTVAVVVGTLDEANAGWLAEAVHMLAYLRVQRYLVHVVWLPDDLLFQ
jgi:hypothetical protein